MVAYPDSFPSDALLMVLDKLRGTGAPVTTADLTLGAWNVAGYALSQALPVQTIVGTWSPTEETSDAEVIEYALKISTLTQEDALVCGGMIPWGLILTIVLRIIADSRKS
jgi:hypothetical protein